MDEKLKEELRTEFKKVVDESISETIKETAGKEVGDRVKEMVAKMRIDRALYGKDASGLDSETKRLFAEDIKNIANGKLFNGQAKAALLTSSDVSGGYLVPTEVYSGIMRVAASAGLVARDSTHFPMGSNELDVPRYSGSDLEGAYIGEDTEATESTVTFGDAKLLAKTWALVFRVGNTLLSDATADVGDFLMALIADGIAVRMDKEGFKGGTFAGSPFVGLLGSDDVTVYTMTTGKDTFAEFDLDEASDIIAQMPESLLGDAAWYFHRTVWAKVRMKKDTAGNYVINQSNLTLQNFKKEGIQPAGELLGYPVFTTDQLPANSATAVSTKFAVFANLKKALFIGDRQELEFAQSDSATVGGKNVFLANQKAMRALHRHAIAIGLPSAAVVVKTAAS